MNAITASARRQLAQVGPTDLSLRAVARDLGMASSAVYRYVSSRDELLTLLIIDGYNAMADHVQQAAARPRSPRKRFHAIGLASREWALSDRQTFALIYGSPVPGYAAPQDTITPATRIPRMLVDVLQDSAADPAAPAFTRSVARSMQPLLEAAWEWGDPRYSEAALALGLMAWTHVIGAISFELFGHRHNVIAGAEADRRAYFEFELNTFADLLQI